MLLEPPEKSIEINKQHKKNTFQLDRGCVMGNQPPSLVFAGDSKTGRMDTDAYTKTKGIYQNVLIGNFNKWGNEDHLNKSKGNLDV